MKSSGLPIWKHHPIVCEAAVNLGEEDNDLKKIQARIAKWEEKKEAEKKQRKECPYGCGKSWARGSCSSISVKKHILGTSRTKCPNFPTDGTTKLKEFYARKKRISFTSIVS